jgi:hypothetical protein
MIEKLAGALRSDKRHVKSEQTEVASGEEADTVFER